MWLGTVVDHAAPARRTRDDPTLSAGNDNGAALSPSKVPAEGRRSAKRRRWGGAALRDCAHPGRASERGVSALSLRQPRTRRSSGPSSEVVSGSPPTLGAGATHAYLRVRTCR